MASLTADPRVEHHAIVGQPVVSRAADFLMLRLDVLRHVETNDEPHIGRVDAHPEGDGGDDHVDVNPLERLLIARAFVGGEAALPFLARRDPSTL